MLARSVPGVSGFSKSAIGGILGKGLIPFLGMSLLCVSMPSCESIYDSTDDCPRGVSLRFTYTYNTLEADAFRSQVDCITVYVFDDEGNYLTQYTETSERLREEGYRMNFPLAAGRYRLVAYGGLAHDSRSFGVTGFTEAGSGTKRADLRVRLLREGNESDKDLHDLFYGTAEVTILEDDYKEITVDLMKDTNVITVALQELSPPYDVDVADYDFRIEDDNTMFDENNGLLREEGITYRPYLSENRKAGYVSAIPGIIEHDETVPVPVAYVELEVSRLYLENADRSKLIISRKSDGREIVSIPLIDYMYLFMRERERLKWGLQEFLDRKDDYPFLFFLQSGRWLNTVIGVESWIVRNDLIDF